VEQVERFYLTPAGTGAISAGFITPSRSASFFAIAAPLASAPYM
jgi:hypothetical protein